MDNASLTTTPDSQLQTTDAPHEDEFTSKIKNKLSHDHPLIVKELAEKELAHEGETSSDSNVFKALL